MTTTMAGVSERPDVAVAPALWRRVLRRPLAVISAGFLLLVVVSSLAAPWVAPYGPLDGDLEAVLAGPSAAHPLGTDSLGRDILSRLLHAGDSALGLTLLAVVVAVVLAVPAGVFTGLVRGWPDAVGMRVADLVLAIPGIIVLLMVLALFDQSMVGAMIALGVIFAPGVLRVARAAAIAVGEEPYIAAARVGGLTQLQIAFRHVLPRVAGPILVNLSLVAGSVLLGQTGLNFLGLGVSPSEPSWGGMIADASKTMELNRWLLIPTGGVVAVSITALVLLGDAVRDASTELWSGGQGAGARRRARPVPPDVDAAGSAGQHPTTDAELRVEDPVVRIENLTLALPARTAADGWTTVVQDVSFDVARGEAVGLVGESGCGKTLTGLALLGLLPAGGQVVSGRIEINGVDVATMSGSARRALRGSTIAFISQDPMAALDPNFSVGSQIGEAVRVHGNCGRPAARARTLELLEQVRIPNPSHVARLYPHQISGGMAQRVSIAIALAGNPSVLIADEPTTALDVTVQEEILQLLEGIQHETGMAVLFISHDWGVVARTCDRCVVMYAGEVVEVDAVASLVARPLHPYSAGLLSADPHLAEPGRELATIPGTVPAPAEWPHSCHFQSRCPYVAEECRTDRIPLLEPEPRHLSRCVRSHLLAEGGASERRSAAERA